MRMRVYLLESRSDRVSSGTSWCKAKPARRQGQGFHTADQSTPLGRKTLWETVCLLTVHTCEKCNLHRTATPSHIPGSHNTNFQYTMHSSCFSILYIKAACNQPNWFHNPCSTTSKVPLLHPPKGLLNRELSTAYNSLLVGLTRHKCH